MSAVAGQQRANPRWLTSFADLCLLLLGFFVILHAQSSDSRAVANGLREAFGETSHTTLSHMNFEARDLFQPGEAVLLPEGQTRLMALARTAGNQPIRIASIGTDGTTRRFDAWELAAARVAAVARALKAGGADEKRIEVSIPNMSVAAEQKRQTISVILG